MLFRSETDLAATVFLGAIQKSPLSAENKRQASGIPAQIARLRNVSSGTVMEEYTAVIGAAVAVETQLTTTETSYGIGKTLASFALIESAKEFLARIPPVSSGGKTADGNQAQLVSFSSARDILLSPGMIAARSDIKNFLAEPVFQQLDEQVRKTSPDLRTAGVAERTVHALSVLLEIGRAHV